MKRTERIFTKGEALFVDEDKLLGREWGDSYNVTVREVYGLWEGGGDTMLSVVCDAYGREHDVSATTLANAIISTED